MPHRVRGGSNPNPNPNPNPHVRRFIANPPPPPNPPLPSPYPSPYPSPQVLHRRPRRAAARARRLPPLGRLVRRPPGLLPQGDRLREVRSSEPRGGRHRPKDRAAQAARPVVLRLPRRALRRVGRLQPGRVDPRRVEGQPALPRHVRRALRRLRRHPRRLHRPRARKEPRPRAHISPYLPHTSPIPPPIPPLCLPHISPGQEARPRALPRHPALVGRAAALRRLLAAG